MTLVATSRNRSADPVQENLREHKSQWNRKVSDIIAKMQEYHDEKAKGEKKKRIGKLIKALIAFKAGMNGFPIPEIGVEKGDIKEPVQKSVTLLAENLPKYFEDVFKDTPLIGSVNQIFSEAKNIIQEQESYSQTRKKPGEKPMQQLPPQIPDQSVKQAGMLGRLWTYVKTPFMLGDKDRWIRKDLLQASAHLERLLKEIQDNILSREEGTIPESVYLTKDFIHIFRNSIVEPLVELNESKLERKKVEIQKSEPSSIGDIDEEATEESPAQDPIRAYTEDLAQRWSDLESRIKPNFNQMQVTEDLKKAFNEAAASFNKIKIDFSVKQRYGADFNELTEMYNKAVEFYNLAVDLASRTYETQALNNPEMIKTAQGDIGRWFRRKWLELITYRDSSLRLSIDKSINEARKYLNDFMNVLQQREAPIGEIFKKLIGFLNVLSPDKTSGLIDNMIRLADMHNSQAKIEKAKQRREKEKGYIQTVPSTDLNSLKRMRNDIAELRLLIEGSRAK